MEQEPSEIISGWARLSPSNGSRTERHGGLRLRRTRIALAREARKARASLYPTAACVLQ